MDASRKEVFKNYTDILLTILTFLMFPFLLCVHLIDPDT